MEFKHTMYHLLGLFDVYLLLSDNDTTSQPMIKETKCDYEKVFAYEAIELHKKATATYLEIKTRNKISKQDNKNNHQKNLHTTEYITFSTWYKIITIKYFIFFL